MKITLSTIQSVSTFSDSVKIGIYKNPTLDFGLMKF